MPLDSRYILIPSDDEKNCYRVVNQFGIQVVELTERRYAKFLFSIRMLSDCLQDVIA